MRIGLRVSTRARTQEAYPTAMGASDQMGEVNGDGDDHRMASRGLQSAERCLMSSGDAG